jgi:hypothetical protein
MPDYVLSNLFQGPKWCNAGNRMVVGEELARMFHYALQYLTYLIGVSDHIWVSVQDHVPFNMILMYEFSQMKIVSFGFTIVEIFQIKEQYR